MPRSLVRYEQLRRRGQPDVQEDDALFAEGRYFDATCLAGDAINQFVYVTGVLLGVPSVTKVDPFVPATMPAIGVIVAKPSATTCLVQVAGQITTFSPVVAGSWYFISATALPSTAPPSLPATRQVIGLGLDTARLLLRPGFGVEASGGATVNGEAPGGVINGVNTAFTTAYPFQSGTTELFLNGLRQQLGVSFDYVEGPGIQTLTLTLPPRSGDLLAVNYVI